MDLVLAIEPDSRQAAILRRLMRERALAELVLVDSKDAAVRAIDTRVPDLILVTALLSPRDEEELMAHLRTLDGADHLQTLTIPQLAGAARPEEEESKGFFAAFRRKKASGFIPGCDPGVFAEEILSYLSRLHEFKAERHALAESQRLSDLAGHQENATDQPGDADLKPEIATETHQATAGPVPDAWSSAPDGWTTPIGKFEQPDAWSPSALQPAVGAPLGELDVPAPDGQPAAGVREPS